MAVSLVLQLSVQRDTAREERSACAALLLARATEEAITLGQQWLAVPPLPPSLTLQGVAWLEEAGFAPADADTPVEVVRCAMSSALAAGSATSTSEVCWCRQL